MFDVLRSACMCNFDSNGAVLHGIVRIIAPYIDLKGEMIEYVNRILARNVFQS